jgi:hypothetical protein
MRFTAGIVAVVLCCNVSGSSPANFKNKRRALSRERHKRWHPWKVPRR